MTESDKNTAANEQLWRRAAINRPSGGVGIARIANTTAAPAPTGTEIYAVTVEEGTVIATLTPVTGFTSTGLTGVALTAQTLFGRWSTITLTSGAVICNYSAA